MPILLKECVAPLVTELKRRNWISKFFYICYWTEGLHLRLRLLPAIGSDTDTVSEYVMSFCKSYLARKPALKPSVTWVLKKQYNELFQAEYKDNDRNSFFNRDGSPIFSANNTIEPRKYEPEYSRYGGKNGIGLSEAHFCVSSEFVLALASHGRLDSPNLVRGMAALIMYIYVRVFLGGRLEAKTFFYHYYQHWTSSYGIQTRYADPTNHVEFESAISQLASEISVFEDAIVNHLSMGQVLDSWLLECQRMSSSITQLAEEHKLVFGDKWAFEGVVKPNAQTSKQILLQSYVHMMNNRLTVEIADEAYLAFLLSSACELLETL
ncbi:MAG: hypothetical protein LKE49_01235 [Bifidobacterium tibiigranuli]|nr:hypothetical protein [Bifidobacterium tibiigranuli]